MARATVDAGAAFERDQPLVLARGEHIGLTFASKASVQVQGPALLASAVDLTDRLLLKSGYAAVDVSGSLPGPRSTFWLITPACTLSAVRPGRFAVRVRDDGSAHLIVSEGIFQLRTAGAEAAQLVSAGQQLQLDSTGRQKQTQVGSPDLERALTQLRADAKPAPRAAATAFNRRLGQLLATAVERVEDAQTAAQAADQRAVATDAGESDQLAPFQRAQALSQARAYLEQVLLQRDAAALSMPQAATPRDPAEDHIAQAARRLLPSHR